VPDSSVGRAQDANAINTDVRVPYNPNQPVGNTGESNVQVPIGQSVPAAQPLPANVGFNNAGGIVDSSALTTQALQGIHYHYHYYGADSFTSTGSPVGYATMGYQNPATAAMPNNPYLQAPIGPGNPAPMNTLAGTYENNVNSFVPEGPTGGRGLGASGLNAQAGSGGIGSFNPFAYGGNGYVEGFND